MSRFVEFVVVLEGLPPTTNTPGRGGRKNWRSQHYERKKWKALIAQYARPYVPKVPHKKARLVITRYSAVEPDFDGLVSGGKALIDGLVECGVLEDDKRSNIGIPDYRWEKAKRGEGKVRVEVYESKE